MSWERVLLPDIASATELTSCFEALDVSVRIAAVRDRHSFDEMYVPELILIGGSVSVGFAVKVVGVAIDYWPSLRLVRLSSDDSNYEPEERHYEVFIGAPLEPQLRELCRPWNTEDFESLSDDMSLPEFHSFVRNFYSYSGTQRTRIEFLGGPRDGDSAYLIGAPSDQAQFFIVSDKTSGESARYKLELGSGKCRYRFLGPVSSEE